MDPLREDQGNSSGQEGLTRTEYHYMSYSDVLERTSISVHKNPVDFIQGVKALDYTSEYSVFPVEVLDAF